MKSWFGTIVIAKEMLRQHFTLTHLGEVVEHALQNGGERGAKSSTPRITHHADAQWCSVYGETVQQSSTVHIIRFGDIIQTTTTLEAGFIRDNEKLYIDVSSIWEDEKSLRRVFWRVVSVLSVGNPKSFKTNGAQCRSYCLVTPCQEKDDHLTVSPTDEATFLIPMTENVRKAIIIQQVSMPGTGTQIVKVLGREEGYPPRCG